MITATWLALGGGKGGVGKTTLAVQIARLATRHGFRTLIADLDPGLPNVDVALRIAPTHTLDDLLHGRCSPAATVTHAPGRLAILAGGRDTLTLADADRRTAESVLARIREAARGFDLVICDAGSGLGPVTRAALTAADLPLCVTTPDVAGRTDAWTTCVRIAREGGQMPGLLLNGVRSSDEALEAARRIRAACRSSGGELPRLWGWVRRDPVIEGAGREQSLIELDGEGPGASDLRAVAAALLSEVPRTLGSFSVAAPDRSI